MDYRNIPGAPGREPWMCGRCRVPFREAPGRGRALVGAAALYHLTAVTVGLPLAFPARALLWLGANLCFAIAVGCLVTALQGRAGAARCPRCGRNPAAESSLTAAGAQGARQRPD